MSTDAVNAIEDWSLALGWFAVGYVMVKLHVKTWWRRGLAKSSGSFSWVREDIVLMSLVTFFFWPVVIPMYHLWTRGFTTTIDRADPSKRERDLRARERHVAELERDLGINQSSWRHR